MTLRRSPEHRTPAVKGVKSFRGRQPSRPSRLPLSSGSVGWASQPTGEGGPVARAKAAKQHTAGRPLRGCPPDPLRSVPASGIKDVRTPERPALQNLQLSFRFARITAKSRTSPVGPARAFGQDMTDKNIVYVLRSAVDPCR